MQSCKMHPNSRRSYQAPQLSTGVTSGRNGQWSQRMLPTALWLPGAIETRPRGRSACTSRPSACVNTAGQVSFFWRQNMSLYSCGRNTRRTRMAQPRTCPRADPRTPCNKRIARRSGAGNCRGALHCKNSTREPHRRGARREMPALKLCGDDEKTPRRLEAQNSCGWQAGQRKIFTPSTQASAMLSSS